MTIIEAWTVRGTIRTFGSVAEVPISKDNIVNSTGNVYLEELPKQVTIALQKKINNNNYDL